MTSSVQATVRELHSRSTNGMDVRLWWSETDGAVHVSVLDKKEGRVFAVEVREGERALDVFHHPYAYAARGAESDAPISLP